MTLVITSLTERLVEKSTEQDIEYEEELVHNAPAITQNAIILVALKVKDNVLHIMAVPFFIPQPIVPANTVAKPPHALPKVLNALIIKQVHILSGNLKATKLMPSWPKSRININTS